MAPHELHGFVIGIVFRRAQGDPRTSSRTVLDCHGLDLWRVDEFSRQCAKILPGVTKDPARQEL
jgi:hypothetical protein